MEMEAQNRTSDVHALLQRAKARLNQNAEPETQNLAALVEILEAVLNQIERDRRSLDREQQEFDNRLLTIETSRFMRLLQLPGRALLEWRGRLGQKLLRSPLHRLYVRIMRPGSAGELYRSWLQGEQVPTPRLLSNNPVISVVLPVHNPKREWLDSAVESVLAQTYSAWQLCVCDDASAEGWVMEYFLRKEQTDHRIRCVRSDRNLGIAAASNQAARLADGDYVAFLDQDDVLAPFALYSVAEALEQHRPDLIYSDEDVIDEAGIRVCPIFRPAFSPDLLNCCMYMGHLLVVRRAMLELVGWLRTQYDGSQDYDLALRIAHSGAAICHIPRILYHWRRHSGSTASSVAVKSFAQGAGLRALSEAVGRKGSDKKVSLGVQPCTYRVRWAVRPEDRASIVICSRTAKLLRRSLRAIEARTTYLNREIIVVQHRTGDTSEMDRFLKHTDCRRVSYSKPFNYSAMNNLGAAEATGAVLVFLNDDVEPLSPEWLDELMGHALRAEVGAVGAKLVYASGAIQHIGMVMGTDRPRHTHRFTFASDFWPWLTFTRNVAAVTGACLATRNTVFSELGGFDECFPVNYNDADYCLRARRAGYEILVEPAAVLRHDECQTRQAGVQWQERRKFQERWSNWIERCDPFYSPHLARAGEQAVLELGSIPARDLAARFSGFNPD